MKRVLIAEILLLFVGAILLYISICSIVNSVSRFNWANELSKMAEVAENQKTLYEDGAITNREIAMRDLLFGCLLYLPAAIADIAVMVLVAVFPLPGIKPLVKRVQAKREARANLRAERAEANKKKRIEELQAELDELKKDE